MGKLVAVLLTMASLPTHHRTSDGALLPDPLATPGPVRPDATREQLCARGFTTKRYRHTTHETKCRAYAVYGLLGPGCLGHKYPPDLSPAEGAYEVDHLVPLTLGGADAIENLWPQPAEPRPGYHEKDALEVLLHRLVCAGKMALADAQACIRDDWRACQLRVH